MCEWTPSYRPDRRRLLSGGSVRLPEPPASGGEAEELAVTDTSGRLLAIAVFDPDRSALKPTRVFPQG